MTDLVLTWLNAGERDDETNAPVAVAFKPLGEDATDEANRDPFGTVPLMNALGVIGMPSAPDDKGHAEAIVATDIGGMTGVCIAARDTRSFEMAAKMKPGDTILHSTGPNKAAQVQCKEEKRQVVIATKRKGKEEQMLAIFDGENDVVQVLAFGHMFQIDETGIHMSSANGATGISLTNEGTHIRGELILGGMIVNPALKLALCAAAGYPLGGIVPAPGVSIGF